MQRNLDMLFVNTVGRQYKIHNPKSITSGVRTLYPYTVYGMRVTGLIVSPTLL